MKLTYGQKRPLRCVRVQRPRCMSRPLGFVKPCQSAAGYWVFSDPRKTPYVKPWLFPFHPINSLTPIPLTNRQTRQVIKPGILSIYVFANPNNAIDSGEKDTAPISAALGRPSATHFPAQFLRHSLIVRSEMRPANGAPTCSHKQ